MVRSLTSCRRWRIACAIVGFLAFFMGRGAVMAQASVTLEPDPAAYCETVQPLGMAAVDGDTVQFKALLGTPGKNNWKCQLWVSASGPPIMNDDGDDQEFTFPPFTVDYPINWEDMCNTQYPGATAVWTPGPELGVGGAPWSCQGAPGVTYDPAEKADGTHDVMSG